MDSRKNLANKLTSILLGICLPIFGVIAIVLGNNMNHMATYNITESTKYGGDAYTGIQNAAADTSNNIRTLGNQFANIVGQIMIFLGIFIIVLGIIFLIRGIIYPTKSERKRERNFQPIEKDNSI